ncbi:MAG: hypothetical protein ACYDCH_02480 [Gaiellaceae bacterium]
MTRRSKALLVALAASALAAASAVATGTAFGSEAVSTATTPPSFTNFELAGTPPAPAGTVCPGSPACTNGAAEPAIRATPNGSFFGSSENGLGGGTLAWGSTDGGLHYYSSPSPNDLSAGGTSTGQETGLEPGGGDTDVAVASAPNAAGNYNVYVASLTLANIDVSTSTDNGRSYTLNPVTSLPIDDRPWIAATGASKVCLSYLTAPGVLLPQLGLHVQCSSDAGQTFTQISDAYDTSNVGLGARNGSRTGNLAFDPANPSYLYQIFAYATVQDAADPNALLHAVGIAVSGDGGQTWHDYNIHIDPNADTRHYDNQFPNVSVDRAGNVYAFYSDDRNTYYSYSTDHGQTWQGPIQVNKPGETAIMPWSTAGDAGKVDVVYYKTPWVSTDPANPTPAEGAPATTPWTVGFAQNLSATTAGSTFSETTATPTVHLGGVCQGGALCTGNRDLYDDFGIAASPTTGLASIIYSDDQYTNDANNPPRAGCDASQNNTSSCDHTSIATQTAGSTIFTPVGKRCRESDGDGHIHGEHGGEAGFHFQQGRCAGRTEEVDAGDPGANMDFHSTQVQSASFNDAANTVTITGVGLDNGIPVTFTAVGVDNGATSLDVFSLTLSDGYTNAGNLLDGTITLN